MDNPTEIICPICRTNQAATQAKLKLFSTVKFRISRADKTNTYLSFPACSACSRKIFFDRVFSQISIIAYFFFAMGAIGLLGGIIKSQTGILIKGLVNTAIAAIIFLIYWRSKKRISHYRELLGE